MAWTLLEGHAQFHHGRLYTPERVGHKVVAGIPELAHVALFLELGLMSLSCLLADVVDDGVQLELATLGDLLEEDLDHVVSLIHGAPPGLSWF